MSRNVSPVTLSRVDAKELDELHGFMRKQVEKLNEHLESDMKEYADQVDRIEDAAVDRMRDLEEEIGMTLKKMRKDLERERIRFMSRVKDAMMDFRNEMKVAEDR
eukprot:9886617-Karenia_brevis.AAC.1